MSQKTYMAKTSEISRNCYLIDATDKILGKVAAKAATLLRGKHKPTYTPHVDSGDVVIVTNAEKIRVTGKKMTDKIYQKYSGYPSGLKQITLEQLMKKAPHKAVELAIQGMIPKGALGNKVKTKLRVYKGSEHPHQSQKPVPVEV